MNDLVEKLAQQTAEKLNGGEFRDGKWYTEGQRDAWRDAMRPIADRIEMLEAGFLLLKKQVGAARNEALEEAARVADVHRDHNAQFPDYNGGYDTAAESIAHAIRALKEEELR